MRKLIIALLLLCLLGCGWWGFAGYGLQRGVMAWFEDRRADGWQAEASEVSLGGFPQRVAVTLDDIVVADPDAGLAFELPNLGLSFRTLWPGDMRVDLPTSALQVSTPDGRWTLVADSARADLNLHPGTALELEALSLTSGPFRLEETDGLSLFGGAVLTLAMTQDGAAQDYELIFDVTEFAPGDSPRQALLLPDGWPLIFDVLTADADISFDRPFDVTTLESQRPQPQTILLNVAEARWGTMRLFATGTLQRDPQGYAEGELTIKAEDWEHMLDLAENAQFLPSEQRPLVQRVLQGLANGTGVTSDLDVTLQFKNGQTRLGFIPLGPAPSMILR